MSRITNISITVDSSPDLPLISAEATYIFSWVVLGVLCQIINVFGIITNIINIICFVKQGLRDSVNISLLALSISDFGSLVTLTGTCLSGTPSFMSADLPFNTLEVAYLTTIMPHLCFTRVSSYITAFITLERCLCIVAPLKIRNIITPCRAAVINVCVFVIFVCSATPVYAVNRLGMKFSPARNKTVLGLFFNDNREIVEKISFAINNFAIPNVAFVIIVACTAILSVKLHAAAQWRKKNSAQDEKVSKRNQRIAKMVVMISTLFIACFIPISVFMLALGLIPEMSFDGKFINVAVVIFGLGYTLEAINSSMNIFIYYQMSSKYRELVCSLLCTSTVNEHPRESHDNQNG